MFSKLYKTISLSLKNSPEDWEVTGEGKTPWAATNNRLDIKFEIDSAFIGRKVRDNRQRKIFNCIEAYLLYRKFKKIRINYFGKKLSWKTRQQEVYEQFMKNTLGVNK